MKLIQSIILGLVVAGMSPLLVSCTRDIPQVGTLDTDLPGAASVQIFDATVNAKRNYIYVDGVPVTGAPLNFGGVFPATAFAFKVTPGARSFLIKDTALVTTQVPLTFSQTFEAKKSYTIFTYDTITSVKQLIVENKIVIPADTTSRLRFGNFIYNTTAVPAVDVYSLRRGNITPVFTNISTTQVTDFIPYASGLIDTLFIYQTGTKSPLIGRGAVPSLIQTRSYTFVYSGSYKGTKTFSVFATY